MKHTIKRIFIITITALTLLFGSSCEKVDFGNINQNPNQTTEPITSALLTNVLAGLSATIWDQGNVRTIAGYYSQYYSQTQYTDNSRYAKTTVNIDVFYAAALNDLQMIINYNSDDETKAKAAANGSNNNQIAVARIVKAYTYWWLTDIWGNIPYSQALQGKGNPAYDNQETIYKDLIKELKEAVGQFDAGPAATGDILFSGNISKWKRFANSVRLLIALQMSKVDANLAKTEFASALSHSAGVIETNENNAAINFPGGVYDNTFYNYYAVVQRDDEAVSKTLTDWLSSRNDPRINVYGSSTIGFPYGLTRDNAVAFGNANTNFARPVHPSRRAMTSPMFLIEASHIWLARAEAASRGWTGESANLAYSKGIEMSMRQWGVFSDVGFATYLSQPSVDLGTGSALEKIINQEWATWYPNGIRGWSLWRRTDLPVLTPAPGQSNAIPRRLAHGSNEKDLNPESWKAGVASYTVSGQVDSQWGKMWWDK